MIRTARAEDLPEITRLRVSVAENHLSVEQMAERGITHQSLIADMTSGDLGAWVWQETNEILAFAMADRREALIFALFTKPGCEGRGLGTRLLAQAERWLAAEGHRDLWLSTGTGTQAEKFYARKGWLATGEIEAETGEIIFRKTVPGA